MCVCVCVCDINRYQCSTAWLLPHIWQPKWFRYAIWFHSQSMPSWNGIFLWRSLSRFCFWIGLISKGVVLVVRFIPGGCEICHDHRKKNRSRPQHICQAKRRIVDHLPLDSIHCWIVCPWHFRSTIGVVIRGSTKTVCVYIV